jgi:hypothetical protein
MRGRIVVELEGPRERSEDLFGGVLVASLLEAHVVVDAHAGQQRHLLAPQPGDPAAGADVGKPGLLRPDQLAPGPEIFADRVVRRHVPTISPLARPTVALWLPGSADLFSAWGPARTLAS